MEIRPGVTFSAKTAKTQKLKKCELLFGFLDTQDLELLICCGILKNQDLKLLAPGESS